MMVQECQIAFRYVSHILDALIPIFKAEGQRQAKEEQRKEGEKEGEDQPDHTDPDLL